MAKKPVFLKARWEYLAMINYEVDPAILKPHLPLYTEVDLFEGNALISIVGFLFNDTKVFNLRWPLHVNFEEVNLRFYIKHFNGQTYNRGVAFTSEIVPRPCIAAIANRLYNEHYSVAAMGHTITKDKDDLKINYRWKQRNTALNEMSIVASLQEQTIEKESAEEFIFEHYFGYNQLNSNTTIEYAIEHERWKIFPVKSFKLDCDVAGLYGESFVPFIKDVTPHSVFLAKGSEVIVRKPTYLKENMKL